MTEDESEDAAHSPAFRRGIRGKGLARAISTTRRRSRKVFREEDNGCYSRDVLAREDERLPGAPLLRPVMACGKRLAAGTQTLEASRARAKAALLKFPDRMRALSPAKLPYSVENSPALDRHRREVVEGTATDNERAV
jgi:hypothetical protein